MVVTEKRRTGLNKDEGEGRREKWNERETSLSRPSKTPEGREERLFELRDRGRRRRGMDEVKRD